MNDDAATDAKIAAAEARTNTKLARMEGRFDLLDQKLDLKFAELATAIAGQRAEATNNRNNIITAVLGVGVALAAILLAVMAYGDAIFSRGMSVRDLVKAVVIEEQQQKSPVCVGARSEALIAELAVAGSPARENDSINQRKLGRRDRG